MPGSFDSSFDSGFDLSSDPPVVDYVAHALSRLPHMYRSSDPSKPTNVEKDLAARLGPANTLGAAMRAVLTQRNIDTAVGAQLDVLGAWVGRPRNGVTDDEIYRRYIRAQILTNKSDGVIGDILGVARAVLGDGGTIVNSNTGCAAYVLRVEGLAVADDVAAVLVELVLQATSDGVRAVIEWSSADPTTTLYWDTQGVWDTAVWFNATDKEL